MTNKKISTLTPATTPLTGIEVVPLTQSSATDSSTVANLTAGRTVNVGSLISSGTASASSYYSAGKELITSDGSSVYLKIGSTLYIQTGTANHTFDGSNNFSLSGGNFILGTAAKGINFTANTPAAGMTSQLLNWYEEGTWTPTQGAGLTVVGAFSSSGKYQRTGNKVMVSGSVTGATSVAVSAAGILTSNLPITVSTKGHGGATNAAVTASAIIVCSGTNITSSGAIAATGTIDFTATYFI